MSIVNGQTADASDFIPEYQAGEAIAANDAIALDVTDGKIYKASASDFTSARINFIGFAVATIAVNAWGMVNTTRIYQKTSGFVKGTQYYLSNTNGLLSSTAGTVERKVGKAFSNDRLYRDRGLVSGFISLSLGVTYTIRTDGNLTRYNSGGGITVNGIDFSYNTLTISLRAGESASVASATSNYAFFRIMDYG